MNRDYQITMAKMLRKLGVAYVSNLDDEEAAKSENMIFLDEWSGNKSYAKGDRVRSEGIPYKAIRDVTPNPTWKPKDSPSLWAKILILEDGSIPEWEQPESTNGYACGDKVTHNGRTWSSLIDGNVWEPGVTGTENLWSLVVE